jgi:hypothetical protein
MSNSNSLNHPDFNLCFPQDGQLFNTSHISKTLENNPRVLGYNFERRWASVLTIWLNGKGHMLPLLPASLSEDEKVLCRNEWKT